MDLTLILVLGTIAAGILLGLMLGKLMTRSDTQAKIDQAFRRGKEEAEVEKANLAMSLGEQLVKMRDSIQQVAQVYDSTVRVVHDNLIANIDRSKLKQLDGPSEIQLSLDLEPRKAIPEETGLAAAPVPEPEAAPVAPEHEEIPSEDDEHFGLNGGEKNLPLQ